MEHDLAWVRLLIGLHATRARSEVYEITSGVVEMGTSLQFTEDKLTNIMEAAQVSLATPPRLQGRLLSLALLTCPVTSVVCAGHGHGGLSAKACAPFVAGCTVVPQF